MQQHLPSLRGSALLLARGGASEHVNSSLLEACGVALRLGAHGIDVDGAVESGLIRLARPGASGLLGRMRRAGAPELSLSELLRTLPDGPHVPLFVRLRYDECAAAMTVLPREDTAVLRLIATSAPGAPDTAPLTSIPSYVRSALADMPHGPERFFAAARAGGWQGVVLHDSDWTGGVVTLAHRFELEAIADGVAQQHRAVALLRMGIDAISSGWPDRLASAALEFERGASTEA